MYPFRINLFRRVHKPILFIFLCALCLLGIVETTRFDDGSSSAPQAPLLSPQTLPVPHENVHKTMTTPSTMGVSGGISAGAPGDVLIVSSETDFDLGIGSENIFDENLIPVPVVPKQLPFCNTQHSGNKGNDQNGQYHSFEEEDGSASNETSDKIVRPNQNGLKAGKLIVVATLDGKLSVLDHGGKILWSLGTGHFFSSTISTLQLSENGKYVKMIPSLSGGLYKYDGDSLQAMPLSAETLLKRSFKLANDVVITGGKELRTFGVDIDSGNLRYECGMDGCHMPSKAELKSDDEDTRPIVLVVKKQLQTVRAIDSFTGSERWNFSVGSHELALAGVTEGCYEPAEEVLDFDNTKQLFKMLIPEGIIFGADAENKVIWQHKFDSPISQAWTLEKGRLQIVDPIRSAPLVDDIPSLYVGIHKQQLYVQESHPTTVKLKTKFELEFLPQDGGDFNQKTIEWKPTNVKLPIPTGETENENTALAAFYGRPFFVYERDEVRQIPAIEAPSNFSGNDDLGMEEDEGGAIVMLGLSTLWFWWKEVLGISLLTAVLLNILLMRPMLRFVRRETMMEMTRFFRHMMNRQEEDRQALLPRTSSSEESIQSERDRARTVSTSSSHSQPGLLEDQMIPFNSQYLREFEPIQCLGRGGFGVVFEAKKKIDDRNYAVKRIALPKSEKSRDRVMREVKALAKLDHKNIVRYFSAWIESPPMGWLEKSDPLWNCGVLSSPSPTCDYHSDGFIESGDVSVSMLQSGRGKKKDHFEISVPDKTPCEDDSFIVFTTNSDDESEEIDENEIPPLDYSTQNRSFSVSMEKNSIDSDTNSISQSGNGKFFARPTTLNIPSSTDNSWGQEDLVKNSRSESGASGDGVLGSDESFSVMYLYIQQELCQKRTLQEWLRAEKERNLRHIVRIFSQIVEAVEYIHSHNLIHRDLKPSNIFLAGESGMDEEMTAKIGDFGLATTLVPDKLNEEPPQSPTEDGGSPNTDVKLTGHVGTHLYMSPEQNLQKPYDYKVDIFALGLIFFELLVPFSTEMERYDFLSKVRKLHIPNWFADSHPEECKLIKQMVSHRPDNRPDTQKIKVWLKDRIENLQLSNSTTSLIPTLRSKSFPSPRFVDEAIAKNLAGDKGQNGKLFYKAHSFQ